MTRYFIDTEFIEDGHTIDLVSIGVVSEHGSSIYAEVAGVDWSKANDWVVANVKPHLESSDPSLVSAPLEKGQLAETLRNFVSGAYGTPDGPHDAPEFWSWCSAYDWVAICQLFGTMMDKPAGWPNYCRDLQQEMDRLGVSDDELPPNTGSAHNALADALWHRDIWLYLQQVEQL